MMENWATYKCQWSESVIQNIRMLLITGRLQLQYGCSIRSPYPEIAGDIEAQDKIFSQVTGDERTGRVMFLWERCYSPLP